MAKGRSFPGICTPIKETLESFEAITDGKVDDLPEQALLYVGGLQSVRDKAAKMK